MSEEKKEKKRSVGDMIRTVILIIALGVFCYSGYNLLTVYMEYKKGSDEYGTLEEQYANLDKQGDIEEINGELAMKNPIDFESLLSINREIIGWLKVEALDISYPVAQGEDNEYYLHNTFEKTANIAGCIFLDHLNKKNFSDRNAILYGHNMKNGSMFGTLKKFYEEGVFEKSPYIWIYTPEKICKYEIFSCHEVGAASQTYQLTFKDDQDFLDYLQEARENSVVDSKVSVGKEDKVLTLSTCTGNEATRFIVQGKLINTYVSLPGGKEK